MTCQWNGSVCGSLDKVTPKCHFHIQKIRTKFKLILISIEASQTIILSFLLHFLHKKIKIHSMTRAWSQSIAVASRAPKLLTRFLLMVPPCFNKGGCFIFVTNTSSLCTLTGIVIQQWCTQLLNSIWTQFNQCQALIAAILGRSITLYNRCISTYCPIPCLSIRQVIFTLKHS